MAAYSNLSDEQRIGLATRKGDTMYGPTERQRCATHRRRWETFRWVWSAPDESKGETQLMCLEDATRCEYVRPCSECESDDGEAV